MLLDAEAVAVAAPDPVMIRTILEVPRVILRMSGDVERCRFVTEICTSALAAG